MKKFLLSCLTLLMTIVTVQAAEQSYTITFATGKDNNQAAYKTTSAVTDVASAGASYLSGIKATTNASPGLNGLKIGQNKNNGNITLSLSADGQVKPTKIEIKVSANKNPTKMDFGFNVGGDEDISTTTLSSTSINATYQTVTVNTNLPELLTEFTFKLTHNSNTSTSSNQGFIFIESVTVYYDSESGGDVVKAPAITCADNMVIITADAGCEIYYTTDGTEPNTSSAKYNSPFSITAKTTVKAIAVKDGKTSPTTTKECDYIGNYDGFASFAAAGAGTQGTVDGPITAYYQNGQNLYVYDSKNKGMLLFGTTETYTNGDVFESVTGTYTEYGTGKVPEITNYTLGAKSTGSAVSPEDGPSLDEISSNEDWRYKYVKLYDVNITSLNGNNFTIVDSSDETLTLPGYNKFKITVSEGEGFTIEGIVDIFNGNPQIYPISISEGTVYDVVETPVFTPESGATLNIGDEITIACATEGASIHYTTDGSEPTATSEPYTGTAILFTGGTFTVKAIAVKDGMADSDVATATYTEYVEGEETATFNFTTLDDYNAMTSIPQDEAPTAANTTYAIVTTDNTSGNEAEVFIAGKFRMTFTKTSGATNPRWFYANNGGVQCRTYKGNIINISSTDSHSFIKGIEITAPNGTTNFGGYDLVPTDKDGVAQTSSTIFTSATKTTWTATEDAYIPAVTLTNRTTNNTYFTTIKVTYIIDNNVTGIDGIESDDENAPVEYFNLQGIRVNGDNLSTGIYIRRQGSKTTKVLIQR